MYKYYIFFFLLFVTITDITAQTDSTKTEKLPEVVVTADGQIEMSNKALLIPTQLEKKHSTNGFNLLYLMQTPDLEVAKTEHSHPLGMVVSTHFRCGKGVKRGLKNGALPFNID